MCALTSSSLNALPLKPEPIAGWSESTDLHSYLCDLYDDDAEMIDQSGVRTPINHRDYGETLFERGRSSFVTKASEFQTIAEKNRMEPDPFGTPIQIDSPPNFLEDKSFGLMAKHSIVWAGVTEALLSDSQFFSLPHVLEVEEELNCSVLLAKNLYYKQALQNLRSLLELNVLHVYFVGDPGEYLNWQVGRFRVPSLRRPGGLLDKLESRGAINSSLSKSIGQLYEELNGTIHSAEGKMLHRGLRDRRWAGMQFKSSEFRTWCDYVSRAVTVSTTLLLAMLEEMKRQPAPNGIVCDTCRAVNQFNLEEKGGSSVTLRCRRCGVQCTYDAEYAAKFGYA
jgi:hypothetical protein